MRDALLFNARCIALGISVASLAVFFGGVRAFEAKISLKNAKRRFNGGQSLYRLFSWPRYG